MNLAAAFGNAPDAKAPVAITPNASRTSRRPILLFSKVFRSRFMMFPPTSFGGHEDGLGIFAPALQSYLSIHSNGCGHHALRIEWRSNVALGIERDHSAIAMLP